MFLEEEKYSPAKSNIQRERRRWEFSETSSSHAYPMSFVCACIEGQVLVSNMVSKCFDLNLLRDIILTRVLIDWRHGSFAERWTLRLPHLVGGSSGSFFRMSPLHFFFRESFFGLPILVEIFSIAVVIGRFASSPRSLISCPRSRTCRSS